MNSPAPKSTKADACFRKAVEPVLDMDTMVNPAAAHAPRPRTSFIEMAIRLGVLALLLYWTVVLIRPFVSIVIWSVVIAIVLYPSYKGLAAKLGGRQKLAA